MSKIPLAPDQKLVPNDNGKISLCPHGQCGFMCCEFNQGNYIVLYPGELENTELSTAHLQIIDENYHGGKKAICTAHETATCDNGYKPLDCQSYPFFPKAGMDEVIGGIKCPLPYEALTQHKTWVLSQWAKLPEEVNAWLEHVTLVGYEDTSP